MSEDKENKHSGWPRGAQPTGTKLAMAGIIVVIVFGAYILIQALNGASMASPVWLGVILGLVMVAYGIYRRLRGPGALDFPEEGGTNVQRRKD
ncbi:hypothetical protein JTF08_08360 [Micrococcaceae bacterium RIT802]|nr:hypothetical protein [Micrococcaceae bacterium RIT 802]